jgi:hypothetical protein
MLTLITLLALSSPALAGVTETTCELPELDGYASVSVNDSVDYRQAVTSTLIVGGEEAPAVRQACFYQNVPGARGFLCVHELNGVRYEVYPRFKFQGEKMEEAKIQRLGVIVDGANSPAIDTQGCR